MIVIIYEQIDPYRFPFDKTILNSDNQQEVSASHFTLKRIMSRPAYTHTITVHT